MHSAILVLPGFAERASTGPSMNIGNIRSFIGSLRVVFPVIFVCLGCHVSAFAQSAMFELVGYFGSKGTEIGQFAGARSLVADDQGNIIISDTQNHRIQICDYSGACTAFGSEGAEPGQFSWPWGIAVDSQNRIIVADRMNHRIQICGYDGECTVFGSKGSVPGQFWEPLGLDVDSQDQIIVADSRNSRYQICDHEGNCSAFEDVYTHQPGSGYIAPAGITVNHQDRILVSDSRWDLVVFCDYLGECPSAIGGGQESGFPGSFTGLEDTAVDSQNRIFTIATSGMQVCDDLGECFVYSESFPLDGDYPYSGFSHPEGIAVDNADRVLVADSGHGTIMILHFLDTAIKFPINAAISDAWFNPATSGQGFLINVFPDTKLIFLAWFTFDTERPPEDVTAMLGEPGHRWLTAQGAYANDRALLDIVVTHGGVFDAPVPKPEQTIDEGSLHIEFSDCNSGKVIYYIEHANVRGVIPIERIVTDNVPFCEELVPLTPLR